MLENEYALYVTAMGWLNFYGQKHIGKGFNNRPFDAGSLDSHISSSHSPPIHLFIHSKELILLYASVTSSLSDIIVLTQIYQRSLLILRPSFNMLL